MHTTGDDDVEMIQNAQSGDVDVYDHRIDDVLRG